MSTTNADPPPRRRLGELLLDGGIISQDYLEIALLEQKKTKEQLGRIFVKLGLVPEAIMRDLLGAALNEESIDLDKVGINPEVVHLVPKKLVERYRFVPVDWDDASATLTVAMPDTLDVGIQDKIRARLKPGVQIKTLLAGESEIGRAIDKYYGFELSLDGIMRELETGAVDLESLTAVGSGEFSHPMVRLVDSLMADAVRRGASDIHIEPEAGFVRIRYRMDGVLSEVRSMHRDYLSGMVVRIKILSGMNIAETRSPQDGRFSLSISRRTIDFRVASQPTTHGENLVLRILDRNKGFVPLEQLGLADSTLKTLRKMLARPEGIVLVTGPTGSGKTTTLYSMLHFLNTEEVNIMTLEDPVEYPMPMVRQTAVNPTANLGFAEGIRSMLRQDPDIILVGEIRDQDTAQMALRAAMTGHKVFSTLHTNSALGSFPRLLDIGVNAEILSGNISGILAQRLVRKLCVHCKRRDKPTLSERHMLEPESQGEIVLYRPVGCDICFGLGFKGRTTVMEVVRMDDEFDDLIARHGTKGDFFRLAVQKGFKTLAQDGMRLVLQGSVSMDEILRVLDLSPHNVA
ncbi:MAG: type II/IV secretion system protein [Magnetococcales bacterium]|nr:type II/IV secretion system protein [Magnetococcales bacterium]